MCVAFFVCLRPVFLMAVGDKRNVRCLTSQIYFKLHSVVFKCRVSFASASKTFCCCASCDSERGPVGAPSAPCEQENKFDIFK